MHFAVRAALILFLSIFGHEIGVVKSPALFQGKELQVTRFKVMFFFCSCATTAAQLFLELLHF